MGGNAAAVSRGSLLRTRAEIIHTLCLPESAIAALSSVDVPRHASLLRLALTNSYFAFCTNYFCTVPKEIPHNWMVAWRGEFWSAAACKLRRLTEVERPENSSVNCFQWFERPENSPVESFQRERGGAPRRTGWQAPEVSQGIAGCGWLKVARQTAVHIVRCVLKMGTVRSILLPVSSLSGSMYSVVFVHPALWRRGRRRCMTDKRRCALITGAVCAPIPRR